MKIDLYNNTLMQYLVYCILFTQVSVSFNVFGFLKPVSYLALGLCILLFLCMNGVYWHKPRLTVFDLSIVIYLSLLLVFTLLNGTDIKNAIYCSIELLLMLMMFICYKRHTGIMLKALSYTSSLLIYFNLALMIIFPSWFFFTEGDSGGFLLGGNYNQMGCRMITALIVNILYAYSHRKWFFNVVVLSVVCIVTLLLVGSMTSLSNIIMFVLFCMVPSVRLRKYAIIGLACFVLLFQIFVVFAGEGIQNNEYAVYFIEEVLHKDITFTNRTHMWDSAYRVWTQSPIIGWGYVDSEWFTSNMTSFAVGPHNQMYSILIFGGVVLFSLFLWILFLAIRSVWSCFDKRSSVLIMGICTFFFMSTFEMYPFFFLFFLLILAYYYPNIYPKK